MNRGLLNCVEISGVEIKVALLLKSLTLLVSTLTHMNNETSLYIRPYSCTKKKGVLCKHTQESVPFKLSLYWELLTNHSFIPKPSTSMSYLVEFNLTMI